MSQFTASSQSSATTAGAGGTSVSLRPRARRLISGLDDPNDAFPDTVSAPSSRLGSPRGSPVPSREASPIPSKHPSRATTTSIKASNLGPGGGGGASSNGGAVAGSSHDQGDPFAKLWGTSWSAIQGIASDLLGSDASGAPGNSPHRKKPMRVLGGGGSNRGPTSAPSQWGPGLPAESRIGVGSQEERETMLRAKKRESLLLANGHAYATDASGRFKRRTSDDRGSMSAPPAEPEDRDALVYVHPVKKDDTLAGISIKFNCQATVIRKANRMWPNDTVQCRKSLVIPCDACGVKGRPLPDPIIDEDLLLEPSDPPAPTPPPSATPLAIPTGTAPNPTLSSRSNSHTNVNGLNDNQPKRRGSTSSQQSTSFSSSDAQHDPPWIHDSWVSLPHSTAPIEIARLPRRTLGYFPPARRKSLNYSDTLDPLGRRTPATSLDLPRSHPVSPPGSRSRGNSIPVSSSLPTSNNGSGNRPAFHARRSSNNTNAYYSPFQFSGPGGVGTMSRSVRTPGPGQDALNRIFAPHLPNVAPPASSSGHFWSSTPGVTTSNSLIDEDAASVGSGWTTPSGTRHGGSGLALEEVGGKIEGWVRRVAKGVATSLDAGGNGTAGGVVGSAIRGGSRSRKPNASTAGGGGGGGPAGAVGLGGMGYGADLIELSSDPFEIGDDDEQGDHRDGGAGSGEVEGPRGRASTTASQGASSSARVDAGLSLRSRGKGKAD